MRQVIFTPSTANIEISGLPESTLIIVHEMYDTPTKLSGHVVPWQTFKNTYTNYATDQFVIVGANRMIKPSNRCDMVNDYLQVMTKNIDKISIDTTPFIGEPWRVWYHYSLAFGSWMGADYSYPIEGDWQKWFYYEAMESKFDEQSLPLFIHDTISHIKKLKTTFKLYEVDDKDSAFYEEIKTVAFERNTAPKSIIAYLLKECNKHFQVEVGFDSYRSNQDIQMPNLGVYRFLEKENKRRQAIYNAFCI